MKIKEHFAFDIIEKICTIAAFLSLLIGSCIFLTFNKSLFNNFGLAVAAFTLFLLLMLGAIIYSFFSKKDNDNKTRILNFISTLVVGVSGLLIVIFQLVLDFFQPLALFVPPVICFAVFMLFYFLSGIAGIFKKKNTIFISLIGVAFIGIIFTNVIWATTQNYAKFNNSENITSKVVFEKGEGKYATYRIPTLVMIDDKGKDGDDVLVVFTEARCNSALDNSESELVVKTSMNGGATFGESQVALKPEEMFGEVGRIADPTAVYDASRDKICLIFIAGVKSTGFVLSPYYMEGTLCEDGNITWDKENITDMKKKMGYSFSAGPSKGTVLSDGTLAFPIRKEGNNYVLFTNDGKNFSIGETSGVGGETDLARINDNELVMVGRRGNMSDFPRNNHLYFAFSKDNGKTWSNQYTESTLKTPIVMTSVASYNGKIYCSYNDSYQTRANLSYAVSSDMGKTWDITLLYSGASGYSVGNISNDGIYYIIAEMGKVEYHEEVRLFTIDLE